MPQISTLQLHESPAASKAVLLPIGGTSPPHKKLSPDMRNTSCYQQWPGCKWSTGLLTGEGGNDAAFGGHDHEGGPRGHAQSPPQDHVPVIDDRVGHLIAQHSVPDGSTILQGNHCRSELSPDCMAPPLPDFSYQLQTHTVQYHCMSQLPP